VLACFLLNLLFYVLVIYRIRKIKYQETAGRLSKVITRFSFYLIVFFVCWIFDLLTYLVDTIDTTCGIFVFTLIYSALLNLQVRKQALLFRFTGLTGVGRGQGALDFLVYGATNDNIYRRFTTKSSLVHSFFEFLLSPFLIFPAFIVYLRKVHCTRQRTLSIRQLYPTLPPMPNQLIRTCLRSNRHRPAV
jgi:hypothetical protein